MKLETITRHEVTDVFCLDLRTFEFTDIRFKFKLWLNLSADYNARKSLI